MGRGIKEKWCLKECAVSWYRLRGKDEEMLEMRWVEEQVELIMLTERRRL